MVIGSKHWTIRDEEEDVIHQELLGMGGYGEVHKVSVQRLLANLLSCFT